MCWCAKEFFYNRYIEILLGNFTPLWEVDLVRFPPSQRVCLVGDSKQLLSSASTACTSCAEGEVGTGAAFKKLAKDLFVFFRGVVVVDPVSLDKFGFYP